MTVTTPEWAEAHCFQGSPTVLIDGADPFANPERGVGSFGRAYGTEQGLTGSPTLEQLLEVLR